MTMDINGNVGIGTTSPATRMHLSSGTLTIDGTGTNSIDAAGRIIARDRLTTQPATTTNAAFASFVNGGGTNYIGTDDSTGGTFFGTAYAYSLYGGGAYPMIFGTNGSERMRISSTGRVGIGTNSPGYSVDIRNDSVPVLHLAPATLTNGTYVKWDGYMSNGYIGMDNNLGSGGSLFFATGGGNGAMTFDNYNSTAGFMWGNTSPTMVLLGNGNLGVGTTSPATALHVVGGVANIVSSFTYNNGSSLLVYSDSSGSGITGDNNFLAGYEIMKTGNSRIISPVVGEAVTFKSGGNVGIGTTSPATKLHVSSDAVTVDGAGGKFRSNGGAVEVWSASGATAETFLNADGTIYADREGAGTAANPSIYLDASHAAGVGMYYIATNTLGFSTNGSERLRIDGSGNVGIGGSTGSKLHVKGSPKASGFGDQLRIDSGLSNGTAGLHLTDGVTSDAWLYYNPSATAASQQLVLNVNSSTGVVVNGNGNVGIKNASPQQALDVTGTIRQSAVLSCSGGLTTNASGDISGCNSGAGDVTKTGNNAFTGNNSFASSTTFNGGVFGIVSVSTAGYWSGANEASTSHAWGPCIGSTFTITTGPFPLEVTLTGTVAAANNNYEGFVVLMDGGPMGYFSGSNANLSLNGAGGSIHTASAVYQSSSTISGTHSFCVTTYTSGAVINAQCASGPCWMRIKEAK